GARGRVRLPDRQARRVLPVRQEPWRARPGFDRQRRRSAFVRDARVHDQADRDGVQAAGREPLGTEGDMSTDESTAAPPPDAAPAAPATSTELVPLTPPAPVAKVEPDQAPELVNIDPQVAAGLEQKADQFASELGGLDTHSSEFQTKLKAIYDMGSEDIKDS